MKKTKFQWRLTSAVLTLSKAAGTRILWTLLGCGAAFSAFAQDISLRHDLDGKALDTLATLVLRFNDELKGKGRVLLQDSRGLENRQILPNLAK